MSETSQHMIKRMINSTTLEKFGKVAPPPQGAEYNIIDFFCLKDNITQDTGQHCKHEISLTGVQPVHNSLAKALDAFGLCEQARIPPTPFATLDPNQWISLFRFSAVDP